MSPVYLCPLKRMYFYSTSISSDVPCLFVSPEVVYYIEYLLTLSPGTLCPLSIFLRRNIPYFQVCIAKIFQTKMKFFLWINWKSSKQIKNVKFLNYFENCPNFLKRALLGYFFKVLGQRVDQKHTWSWPPPFNGVWGSWVFLVYELLFLEVFQL